MGMGMGMGAGTGMSGRVSIKPNKVLGDDTGNCSLKKDDRSFQPPSHHQTSSPLSPLFSPPTHHHYHRLGYRSHRSRQPICFII